MAGTRLKMELDRVPLWRGDHVEIKQLAEDFARYVYLPRLRSPEVLVKAIRDGLSLLLWRQDSFAYADSFDEAAGRYRGLRAGDMAAISDDSPSGLLVRAEVAVKQQDAEARPPGPDGNGRAPTPAPPPVTAASGDRKPGSIPPAPRPPAAPKRFHGMVTLNAMKVSSEAGRVAEEVIAHLAGLVNADVTVTLEIEARIPDGAPEHVVRTVTENGRSLKFTSHGFEPD